MVTVVTVDPQRTISQTKSAMLPVTQLQPAYFLSELTPRACRRLIVSEKITLVFFKQITAIVLCRCSVEIARKTLLN